MLATKCREKGFDGKCWKLEVLMMRLSSPARNQLVMKKHATVSLQLQIFVLSTDTAA